MQPRSALSTVITALLSVGGLCATRAMAEPAAAGAAATSPSAPAGSDTLEEIQVVAQKQNIDLQKAPVAITALTGDSLAQLNIVNPIDLNGQVPGLVITQSEGYNRSVSIRGIGFNVPQDDSAQTSVSYHEDGIYIAFPVALDSGFLDVDHVEVLRGPQGTVFGQNAIGGTINVISKQPTFDAVNGFVDASLGSYNLEHVTGALNLPVSSTFAIRAAVDEIYQRGYIKAVDVPGNANFDLNNQNSWHARLQALWQPGDDLSVLLRAEYAHANQHEAAGKNIYDPVSDPYQQSSDWPGAMIYNQQLAGATITYNFSAATLKAISSYQEVNHHGSVNEDGLNYNFLSSSFTPHDVEWFEHNSKSITEEVNLASKPGTNLDWIVGAFYLKSRTTVAYDQYNLLPGFLTLNGNPTPDLLNVPNLQDPSTAVGAFQQNAVYSGQLYFANVGSEGRDSASFYGQATYHFTDALRLTAGLRYTHDHNTTWFDDFYNLFYPNTAIFVEQTADKTTWRLALDYDLTPTNLLYGSVSTGFKPGGGNISNSPLVVPFQFEPETITAYEIGSKNSLFDKKLNVNVAAFLYKDKNMQFQAEDLINFQGGVDNIPDVQIYGFETEVAALLPWNLRLDGNLTWEKGKITSHFDALDNVAGNEANQTFINNIYAAGGNGTCVFYGCNGSTGVGFNGVGSPALNALRLAAYRDVYGNAPPSLPDVIATVNLSHTLTLGGESSLLSRVSAQYRASYATSIFGENAYPAPAYAPAGAGAAQIYRAPSYTVTNLFFDYVLSPKTWDFSLAITNVFDRAQISSRFTNEFGGETTQVYAPPREFVVGAHFKF
jgi:iron complex outermembrane receptor protein